MDRKHKILVVDDNKSIHEDIRSVLVATPSSHDDELLALEESLFDDGDDRNAAEETGETRYIIDDAYQGEEAIELANRAQKENEPYSVVFVDVRMPPGIDGIQTIKKLWENHPFLEMVICTAYSDYSWNEIVQTLGRRDNLLFLKKPFDTTALKQITLTLATKWCLKQESLLYVENLEREVERRTTEMNKTIAELVATLNESGKTTTQKRRQTEFFNNLLEALPTGILGIDESDRIVCCNRKFALAAGITGRDLTERYIFDASLDPDLKGIFGLIEETKSRQKATQVPARIGGKIVNLCVSPLLGDHGKYSGIVMTLQ
jgi:CheY-like chemotaxis protein